jgi:hypothetical protein
LLDGVALVRKLIREFTLLLCVRGISMREYFAGRDPNFSNAYNAALVLYAVVPGIVLRGQSLAGNVFAL